MLRAYREGHISKKGVQGIKLKNATIFAHFIYAQALRSERGTIVKK